MTERMTTAEKIAILEDLARNCPSPTARVSALRELRLMDAEADDVDRFLARLAADVDARR